jgi:Mn-dependent DtxR family transcriptional regulator
MASHYVLRIQARQRTEKNIKKAIEVDPDIQISKSKLIYEITTAIPVSDKSVKEAIDKLIDEGVIKMKDSDLIIKA